MIPLEEAFINQLQALETLEAHRSPWVKEVVRKTKERTIKLLGKEFIERMEKAYNEEWKERNKFKP